MHRSPVKKLISACWLMLGLLLGASEALCGAADSANSQTSSSQTFAIGISGHYRVGRWVGIRTPSELHVTAIETRDGDGVQVRYPTNATSPDTSAWTYVIPGSEAAPLVLQNLDATGNAIVAEARFPTIGSPARGPAMIPLSTPWVLVLGDPIGIDQIGVNRILNRDATIAVTRPISPTSMPDSSLGFDGIDMIVINHGGTDLLAKLSPRQQQAIVQWVTGGGEVLLSLGDNSSRLMQAAPWLSEILPVEISESTTIDPSAIETYTSSQTPLKPFVAARLPKNRGEILILGRDQRRISTPIAVRYTVGFGTVLVVAADLESQQFADWPERMDLIARLTGDVFRTDERAKERTSRSTAYNDLAGQTRATLDRFSIQRTFRFSVLALSLMALIAAIGPLDYFLVNRVFGRPLLGWLSFPIMAIGLSVVLASQSTVAATNSSADISKSPASAPDTVRCNRIEIVDVDAVQRHGRGFSINYLYTHDAARYDIRIEPTELLRSIAPEIDSSITAPFGYPGESFGGIQISIEDARLPVYSVESSASQLQDFRSISELPLAPRSSKGFYGQVTFKPSLAQDFVLERRPGSELLQGELVNPLPFDLLDAKLVYRNWVYLLPTRFRAGARIGSLEKLRQKNFRWLLSRQKALESSSETQAWDPTARTSVSRVAEMLMFHRATGGSQYTNLENDPLAHLDLSHVLGDDRCILFGSLDSSLTSVDLTAPDHSFTPTGEALTIIRVILPVTDIKRP